MPDPAGALVFDARTRLGAQPALHALVVGVSSYPYLRGGAQAVADPWNMGQLSSTATSAFKIYEWLRKADAEQRLPVPLGTCRLLLSPSAGETALTGRVPPATIDNLIAAADAWREDGKTHRDGMTILYFAGHGVQRTQEDAVLCLEDFRKPPAVGLNQCAALANIRGGMAPAPGFLDIARTQLYFIDACREHLAPLDKFEPMSTSTVFPVVLASTDDRSSPIFFAAIPNRAANAVPDDQSLFSRGLIECLEGEAGVAMNATPTGEVPWAVTVTSLSESFDSYKIDDLNRRYQADQTYAPGGQMRQRVICFLKEAPMVRYSLEISPEAACAAGRLTFGPAHRPALLDAHPIAPHPVVGRAPGGYYSLEVAFGVPGTAPSGYKTRNRICELRPAVFSTEVKVD